MKNNLSLNLMSEKYSSKNLAPFLNGHFLNSIFLFFIRFFRQKITGYNKFLMFDVKFLEGIIRCNSYLFLVLPAIKLLNKYLMRSVPPGQAQK